MSPHNAINTIVICGASGFVGKVVLDSLIESGRFHITVLTRSNNGEPSSIANSNTSPVQYKSVDYESVDDLTHAFVGQDAVISTIGKGDTGISQKNLVDAAAAAGVKHFIPSEFGADLENPRIAAFPIYQNKVKLENHLREISAKSSLTYTCIYNNVIFEFGLRVGSIMDLAKRSIRIYDGGSHLFTAVRLNRIGHAIVEILSRYEDFANKAVRIGDITISQQELLKIAQRLTPNEDWTVTQLDTSELVQQVQPDLSSPKFSIRLFNAYAIQGAFGKDFDGHYAINDNEVLGIREMSENELQEYLASFMAQPNLTA